MAAGSGSMVLLLSTVLLSLARAENYICCRCSVGFQGDESEGQEQYCEIELADGRRGKERCELACAFATDGFPLYKPLSKTDWRSKGECGSERACRDYVPPAHNNLELQSEGPTAYEEPVTSLRRKRSGAFIGDDRRDQHDSQYDQRDRSNSSPGQHKTPYDVDDTSVPGSTPSKLQRVNAVRGRKNLQRRVLRHDYESIDDHSTTGQRLRGHTYEEIDDVPRRRGHTYEDIDGAARLRDHVDVDKDTGHEYAVLDDYNHLHVKKHVPHGEYDTIDPQFHRGRAHSDTSDDGDSDDGYQRLEDASEGVHQRLEDTSTSSRSRRQSATLFDETDVPDFVDIPNGHSASIRRDIPNHLVDRHTSISNRPQLPLPPSF